MPGGGGVAGLGQTGEPQRLDRGIVIGEFAQVRVRGDLADRGSARFNRRVSRGTPVAQRSGMGTERGIGAAVAGNPQRQMRLPTGRAGQEIAGRGCWRGSGSMPGRIAMWLGMALGAVLGLTLVAPAAAQMPIPYACDAQPDGDLKPAPHDKPAARVAAEQAAGDSAETACDTGDLAGCAALGRAATARKSPAHRAGARDDRARLQGRNAPSL